jgi:hypothetical protein
MKSRNRFLFPVALAALLALPLVIGVTWLAKRQRPGANPATTHRPASAPPSRVAFTLNPSTENLRVPSSTQPEQGGTLVLNGVVLDASEAPVVGATVGLDITPSRKIVTDENGRFQLTGLNPRPYRLEAWAGRLYAGPVTFPLQKTGDTVILRAAAGVELRVVVTAGRTERPVAGAEVELRSSAVWSAQTDSSGQAALTGVGPGWRTLRVLAAGYAPSVQLVSVDPSAPVQRHSVKLETGAPVRGRVVDSATRPVAGAKVWARSSSDPFPTVDPTADAVVSARDGSFELKMVAAGTYQFMAADGVNGEAATPPIALDGVTALEGIEIRMLEGSVLTGTVLGPEGGVVAGARVRVSTQGTAWAITRDAYTSPQGRFRFAGLPRRTFTVAASAEQGSSPPAEVNLERVGERELNLHLTLQATIAGMVVDGRGEPLADAQVMASAVSRGGEPARDRQRHLAVTSAGGQFKLRGLTEGSYKLRAARAGSDDGFAVHPGVIAETGATDVKLVVPGDGEISGRVITEDGKPVPQFAVTLGERAARILNEAGEFSMTGPAGTHRLLIDGPFLSTVVPSVSVREGTRNDIGVIRVKRGRTVRGRVVLPDGTPVPNAEVVAGALVSGDGNRLSIRSEGVGTQHVTTDENGAFVLQGFDERPLVAVAQAPGKGRSNSVSLPRSGSGVNVDLVLQPTGGLEGRLTRGGTPLADIVVIANPRGATRSNFFVTTGPEGSFSFAALAAGPYTVTAMVQEANNPRDAHIRSATVTPGNTERVDVQIPAEGANLEVKVTTAEHRPVHASYVALLSGVFDARNVEALRTSYQPLGEGALYVRQARGERYALFKRIPRGTYTFCVAVSALDPPAAGAAEERRAVEGLPTHCSTRPIAGDEQITLVVPATASDPLQAAAK